MLRKLLTQSTIERVRRCVYGFPFSYPRLTTKSQSISFRFLSRKHKCVKHQFRKTRTQTHTKLRVSCLASVKLCCGDTKSHKPQMLSTSYIYVMINICCWSKNTHTHNKHKLHDKTTNESLSRSTRATHRWSAYILPLYTFSKYVYCTQQNATTNLTKPRIDFDAKEQRTANCFSRRRRPCSSIKQRRNRRAL